MFKVFISSVSTEIKEYRTRIAEVLSSRFGMIQPIYPALDYCADRECDAFVFLYSAFDRTKEARRQRDLSSFDIETAFHSWIAVVREAIDDRSSELSAEPDSSIHALSKYDCLDYRSDLRRKIALVEKFCAQNENRYLDENSDLASFVTSRAILIHSIFDNIYGLMQGNESTIAASISNCIDALSRNRAMLHDYFSKTPEAPPTLSEFREHLVSKMISSFGISVGETDDDGGASYLISVGNDHRIYCASGIDEFARSFTILHELAHLRLDHVSRFDFSDDKVDSCDYRHQEYACDQFAALMLRCIEGLYLRFGGDASHVDFDDGIVKILLGSSKIVREFNSGNSRHSMGEIVRRFDSRVDVRRRAQVPCKPEMNINEERALDSIRDEIALCPPMDVITRTG